MRRVLLLLLAAITTVSVRPPAPAPTTILVGQSTVGLWRAGKLVALHEEDGWQFNAVRLDQARGTLQIAGYRKDGRVNPIEVFRFDARTLALRGRSVDPSAGDWDPHVPPLDVDLRDPDTTGPGGLMIATPVVGGRLLRLRGAPASAPAHRLPRGTWRVAVSPDGSTAAAFAKPVAAGARWRGQAWDTRTGRAIAAPGLFIDDGTRREDGAERELACLLPRGEGAIFTYNGPPADDFSEYQRFGARAAPVAQLDFGGGDYVMSCLVAR